MNVRGYGRRSDDDQSAYSPPAQERACKDWTRANGHEWKGWFFDDDLSGKREDRPELQKLLRTARRLVVAWRAERQRTAEQEDQIAHLAALVVESEE